MDLLKAALTAGPRLENGAVPSNARIMLAPDGPTLPVEWFRYERAALLKRPNVVRIALGPRILRADTAAVAALTLVQAVLGDWRSA